MHQQAHAGLGLHPRLPGAQAMSGDDPAIGAALGTRTTGDEGLVAAGQAFGAQARYRMAHAGRPLDRLGMDTRMTRKKLRAPVYQNRGQLLCR
ncbi:hypothetical protein D3C85_1530450 [compost metagenome]